MQDTKLWTFRHPRGSQRHTQQEFNVQPHFCSKRNTEKSSITGISCLVCIGSPGELWSKKKKKKHSMPTLQPSSIKSIDFYQWFISMGVPPFHDVHIWLTSMLNQMCVFGEAVGRKWAAIAVEKVKIKRKRRQKTKCVIGVHIFWCFEGCCVCRGWVLWELGTRMDA